MQYEIYETKKNLDGLKVVLELNLDNYSALIICGGDGTIHEVINGLLRRPDKKKLPIGLIPNGSGDDICGQIGMQPGEVEMGLRYIRKGDTIKIDVSKVLIDHEDEDHLQETLLAKPSAKIENYLRYEIINSSFCILSNTCKNAVPLKPYFGK